jgi:hypothetical protein
MVHFTGVPIPAAQTFEALHFKMCSGWVFLDEKLKRLNTWFLKLFKAHVHAKTGSTRLFYLQFCFRRRCKLAKDSQHCLILPRTLVLT